jgi:hypothetical protein
MKGLFHLYLVRVGWNAELTQSEWGRAAQSLPSENKTFHHLVETGSD